MFYFALLSHFLSKLRPFSDELRLKNHSKNFWNFKNVAFGMREGILHVRFFYEFTFLNKKKTFINLTSVDKFAESTFSCFTFFSDPSSDPSPAPLVISF